MIRTTTPLLLATLGGLIADLSGALNVALEGMMLIGCLTAVIVSVYTPWYVAVLAGTRRRRLLGLLMAFFALRMKADIILVGFAINILAAGGTVFALTIATGGDKGTSINLVVKAVPALDLCFLGGIPGVGADRWCAFLSGHSVLSWIAALPRLRDLVLPLSHAVGPVAARRRRVSGGARSGRHPGQQGAHLEPASSRARSPASAARSSPCSTMSASPAT